MDLDKRIWLYITCWFFSMQAHCHKDQLLLFICHTLPRTDGACQWGCHGNQPSCDCSDVRRDFDPSLPSETWSVWPELWYPCGWTGALPQGGHRLRQAKGSRARDIPQLWRYWYIYHTHTQTYPSTYLSKKIIFMFDPLKSACLSLSYCGSLN